MLVEEKSMHSACEKPQVWSPEPTPPHKKVAPDLTMIGILTCDGGIRMGTEVFYLGLSGMLTHTCMYTTQKAEGSRSFEFTGSCQSGH